MAFSCERDDWITPPVILDRVRTIGRIALDPCPGEATVHGALNIRHGRHWRGWYGDGLSLSWKRLVDEAGGGLVFVNPPYGGYRRKLKNWIAKCISESEAGCEVVCLVPAAVGSRWFRPIFETANAGCAWFGRVQFLLPDPGDKRVGAPFWSFLAYWGERRDLFFEAFDGTGELMRLNAPRVQATDVSRAGRRLGLQARQRRRSAACSRSKA